MNFNFFMLAFLYTIKSTDGIGPKETRNKIEKFKKFIINELGIENGLLNRTNRIKRGIDNDNDESSTQLRAHMLNLIDANQSKTDLKQYNLIKSILGQSRGKTIRSKVKRFFVNKQKRVERTELNERFTFDLKNNFGHVLDFELDVNLDLSKLFQDRLEIGSNVAKNRLEIQMFIIHKSKILCEKRMLIDQNDSQHEEDFFEKLKNQKLEFDLKQLRVLRKKFLLRFRLIAKFRSTSRTLSLSQNQLLGLNDLLINRPVLTAYSRSYATLKPIEMTLNKSQVEHYLENSKESRQHQMENRCQSKSITIDFEELGWHHVIIEPKYIKTHYCDGSCSFPFDDNNSNSAESINQVVLQTLASRSKRYGFLPKPCCSPAQLSSKHFLFVDENNSITLKKVDNIVIDSCSCR